MSKNWLETDSIDDSKIFAKDFWMNHRIGIENGNFWADDIKELKGNPYERCHLALDNLPLPAAFREGMTALRAIIRDKKKNKMPFDDELKLMYWFAAIDSFSIPCSSICNCPGYNIIESIPGKKIKGLSFEYDVLGYKHLKLLKVTDIKWLVLCWGEPTKHTTLHSLYQPLWHEYELKYLKKYPIFNPGLSELVSLSLPGTKKRNKNQYFSFSLKYMVLAIIILITFALTLFN